MNWLTTIVQAFGKPFQWWVVIAPWEMGLRIRLGKVSLVLKPGIHFRIPFLDRVYVQSVRLRTMTENNQTATTKDGFPITISLAVDFSISDVKQLFNTLAAPEMTLVTRVVSEVARYVSLHNKSEIEASKIEEAVNKSMDASKWGLGEFQMRITGFSFARTYRILMHEYKMGANLGYEYDLEHGKSRR